MIEAEFSQVADAYALTFGAFEARLDQALKLTKLRLGLPTDDGDEEGMRKLEGDDSPAYTGLLI